MLCRKIFFHLRRNFIKVAEEQRDKTDCKQDNRNDRVRALDAGDGHCGLCNLLRGSLPFISCPRKSPANNCKKESKNLRAVYDSLQAIGKRNFDVYAIANDADIDRWKKYVKENNYPWLQVGGNKGNLDYLEYFNIYEMGNPAMFIMDNKDHRIILNKRIEMSNIPQFLEEYEKIEEYKRKEGQ